MDAHNAQPSLQLAPLNYLKNALHLLENEQLQEALQSMDAAIVFSNNSPFYIYQKIRFLFDLGAYKSCSQLIISQFEYLFKHSSLYILCRCIDYYQKINQLSDWELIEVLNNSKIPYCLANIYPEVLTSRERPYFKRAKKALVQDHYSLCIAYCNLNLKLNPGDAESIYMKAYSYHMLNHLDIAISYYREYLKLVPTSTSTYIELASAYLENGKYSDALLYFQKASYMDPTNKEYLSYIGECYIASKNYGQAIETYQTVDKFHPNDLQNYFNLSYVYHKSNKKSLSKRYKKKIIKQLTRKY